MDRELLAAMTEYVQLSQKVIAALLEEKGDVGGHAFHGNRYTGGIGGSGNLPFNAHGDQYFHALSPKGQAYVKAQCEKFGVTPDGIAKEVEGRLRNPDGSAKTDVIAEGAKWYPMAHEVTVKVSESTQGMPHPVSPEIVATVLAELSPQTPWATNVEVGARLSQWYAAGKGDGMTAEQATLAFKAQWQAEGWGGKTKGSGYTENAKLAMMNGQVTEALQVLTGEKSIEESLTSPKQRSFANNIMLPGQTKDVTVDVMMQKAITYSSGPPPLPKTPDDAEESGQDRGKTVSNFFNGTSVNAAAGAGYVTVAAGTRIAAEHLGISPDVAQASYWLQVQDQTPPGWPRSTGKTMPDMATPLVTQLLGHPFIGTGNPGKGKAAPIFPLSVDYGTMALTEAETMTDDEVEAELAEEDSEVDAEEGAKYSADQPRDDHGRFGEGSDSSKAHIDLGVHLVRQHGRSRGDVIAMSKNSARVQFHQDLHARGGEHGAYGPAGKEAKGDVTGHPFHGNRYTGGIGGGEEEKPIRVSSIDEAIALLGEGKGIMFERPDQAVTLLHKLAQMAQEAKAAGREAKAYDLCKVSVTGTNLFCSDNVGIPREAMPQLVGKPLAGTPADSMPKNAKGEVDLSQAFRDSLEASGNMIIDTNEFASHLRASQTEMDGTKVGGMMEAMEAGKIPPAAIFVSDDNYIVDGHHRWAATVGVGLGDKAEMSMPVARVNMKILPLLARANQFADSMGIPQAGLGKGATYLVEWKGAEWQIVDEKGDVVGHGFHGNRYTGGIGGSLDPVAAIRSLPTLANGHSPGLVAKINEVTNELLPLDHERAVILARDGSVIASVNGDKDTVTFSQQAMNEIATATLSGGAVALHNHPSGSGASFSPVDVATGFRFGFSEIRVAADPWIYVMRPGKLANEQGQFAKGHGMEVVNRGEQLYMEGSNYLRDETHRPLHDIWGQVAHEYGLEYFRVHVGDKERFPGGSN